MVFGTNTFGSPYFAQGPEYTCSKYYAGDWALDWCEGSSSSSSVSSSSSSSRSSSSSSQSGVFDGYYPEMWKDDWPAGFRRPIFEFDKLSSSSSSSSYSYSYSWSSSSESSSSSDSSSSSSSAFIIRVQTSDIYRYPVVFVRPVREESEKISIGVRLIEEYDIKPDVIINSVNVIDNDKITINIKTIKSK